MPASWENVAALEAAVRPEVPGNPPQTSKKIPGKPQVRLECSPEPPQQAHRLFPQEQWSMRSPLLVGTCAAFISVAVLAQQSEPTTPQAATAATAPTKLTDAQIEDFLLH